MNKLRAILGMSFRAKVLVPLVAVMFLLLAVTIGVVDRRIAQQMETEAKQSLTTADGMFRSLQGWRTRELLARVRILARQPVYRSALALGDAPTASDPLEKVLHETGVDIVMFTAYAEDGTTPHGPLFKTRSDLLISLTAFEAATREAVRAAVNREEKTDTIQVENRLYGVVSIPVVSNDTQDSALYGVLTLGSEIGLPVAAEFRSLTDSRIVLLANGHVSASGVSMRESGETFVGLFKELAVAANQKDRPQTVRQVVVRGEHFFCSARRFESLNADDSLGYLLLSSYEQPLLALQMTRQIIINVGLLAIVMGSLAVWLVVSRATQPLEELRDSAEAVGQGDFSRRVEVRSQDECGQLARVFNRMTENLQQSREQLELTVDTLKTTQAQLIQSEKLSGIGEFVAGVAHELNNPLTSVMGFSELLTQADTDPRHKRYLEMIHTSAGRCQKIVQSLLSFARRRKPERKVVCVNGLIEAAVEILNYQLRTSNIEVLTRFDPELPQAMVDPHQVQQVFLNLLNNARQAIEDHQPKGWIKITTATRGPFVRVTIQDSGPGIPPESLSKIFDPFFTTKDVGKGTGLGLSLCYGIIKEHGGTILPRSQPGEAATFIIELPITHEPPAGPTAPRRTPDTEFIDRREGAGKKVLVIDDEEPILQMVREALSCRGYQVDLAADGETGLRRLSQARYDVTLCDWKMPGLSGQDVFERLRAIDHAQAERIIFITGDVVSEKTRSFFDDQRRVCLPKPFTLVEVREAIGKMLATS